MQNSIEGDLVLGDGSERKFLATKSSVVNPAAAKLAEEHLVMPQTWTHTKEGGRHAREIGIKFGLENRLGNVGRGLYYQLIESNAGTVDVGTVGRRRLARLIGHWNNDDVRTTVVNFPGFGHTHLYEDPIWFMQILAEIAQRKRCNFLCVNPHGRGIPGFDRSQRISNVGLADSIIDTNAVTDDVLDQMATERGFSARDWEIVARGHSLGALYARKYGHHVATSPVHATLVGMIQEAGIAAGWVEDLSYGAFLASLLPLSGPLLKRLILGSTGLDFSLGQQASLFYGSVHDTPENLLLAAYGQQQAEVRPMVEAVLGSGDLAEYRTTVAKIKSNAAVGRRGYGNHFIMPTADSIFQRECNDEMLAVVTGAEVHHLTDLPHCYVPAIPSDALVQEVRGALLSVFRVSEKIKQR